MSPHRPWMPSPSARPSSRARAEPWVASGLVVAAMAALAYHCGYLAVPIVDDAAISLAYGLTFFAGEGLRVTPVSQPVEGFSNPLWTLLLGLSGPLRLPPEGLAHGLGVALGVMAPGAFALWGPASEGRRPRLEDALPAWVAALNPTYAYWISSGMETGLQALLLGMAGALFLKELRTGGSSHVGWALGLLCLTRPEGALYTAAAGLLWCVQLAVLRRWPGRQEARIALWLGALVGGWLLVRWVYFADLLPNTYYAKRFWDFDARGYLAGFFGAYPRLWQLAAAGLVLGLAGGRWRRTGLVALLGACAVYFAWSARGDWMREWRFLAPLVPLLGAAMAAGVASARRMGSALAARGTRWVWPSRAGVAAVALSGLLVLVPALGRALTRAPALKANPELPFEYISGLFRPVKERTEALGQLRPLLAYPDLGGQAMVLRHAEVIDVAGLADYALAHHAGNPAALEDYLLSEGPPILVDAHGPSGHLRAMKRLMALYEGSGPVRQLKGLSAREDPRCPGGKQATLALGAEALAQRLEEDIREGRAEEALRRWRCAFAYQARERLPDEPTRERLADLAGARGDTLRQEGQRLPALRHYSLATLLDDGNAHRRRKTERLRAELFPRTEAPSP